MPRVGRWTPVAGRNAKAPTAGRNARDTHTPEPTCMPRVRSYEPVSRRVITPLLPRVTRWEPQAARRRDG
jgi:hypothetical protein